MAEKKFIYLISDGTGETASKIARAFLVQFRYPDVVQRKFIEVREEEQIDEIVNKAIEEKPLVISTIADKKLRDYANDKFKAVGIEVLDLFGYYIERFEKFFGQKARNISGLLHKISDQYFEKVKAIEYTVEHDDNRSSRRLDEADIILVGLSRTSKTPLSIYLAQEGGYKVANFAIVKGEKLPDALFKVDQNKIVGLTIDPMRLYEIRKQRAKKLGIENSSYASLSRIYEEVEYANSIFRQHPQWLIIDVTNRSVEESASEIVSKLFGRKL
ncbi:pyruvate, water dikinase regulatory protein [Hippea jasoniae]|uniref:pyruvate, water dikinase regulatory protein n=1 Tax=Hippea jasoniae TaxID=944479 RepID=UPI0005574B6A|nr:pyruvate, water dikinase regulatory protein [Hippea jasoniae]